jgi:GNAT superfamily N-acetyltransferase
LLIKELTVSELPAVAELGPKFWLEAGLPGSFVPAVFTRNWTLFMEGGIGRIFAAMDGDRPVGVLGVLFTNDINDDAPIASEAFWFVEEGHRGCGMKLFLTAMHKVEELGCKRMSMVHLENINEHLAHIYQRMGFVPTETHYIKTLS